MLPDSGFVELDDTITPRARPLNGAGDSVAGTVYWAALDTAVVTVLDSETGATLGKTAGSGRIQARTGNLRSNPVTLVVQPPLDSIRPAGELRDTIFVSGPPPDSLSDSLVVRVFAPMPPAAAVLRRRVSYEAAVFPSPGPAVTLLPSDTVLTNAGGTAAVQVRLDPGALPDSVVVTARAARHDGTPVDSSLTFVVEFRP